MAANQLDLYRGPSNSRQKKHLFETDGLDFYELMGVAKTATTEEIKAQYKVLAKTLHPDKNPSISHEHFARLSAAYRILSDEEERKRYDAMGCMEGGDDCSDANEDYTKVRRQANGKQ